MCVQPSVGEYDITQLHENTYYDVCVKVFTSQLSVSDDYNLDRQHTANIDVWNNFEGSAAGLDRQHTANIDVWNNFEGSAAGLDRQHPASIDVWNNFEGSAAGLADGQLFHQSAAGSDTKQYRRKILSEHFYSASA